MKPYIKPPEPEWTAGEQLRFLAELLRTTALQAGTLQNRRGLKPAVLEKINRIVKKLDYCYAEAIAGHVKPGAEANAEDYFDNEGALLYEACNEVRKAADRRTALGLLYAYNAGLVHERAEPKRAARRVKSQPLTIAA